MLYRFQWFGDIEDHFLYKLHEKLPRSGLDPDDGPPRYQFTICSPGGSLIHGLAAAEYLLGFPDGVPVHAVGQCMSAALIVLASGAKGQRTATPLTRFMGHGAAANIFESETVHGMKIESTEMEYMEGQYLKILADRTKKSLRWWERRIKSKKEPWYFDAAEAKRYGLIDRVVTV